MEPDFRSQYRGHSKGLTLHGEPIETMDREELIAVIGFLFEQIATLPPDRREKHPPPRDVELDPEFPRPNNGLFEG